MLKLALGMGSLVMLFATLATALVITRMCLSAAHHFLLK
jgi:hypothetical protein